MLIAELWEIRDEIDEVCLSLGTKYTFMGSENPHGPWRYPSPYNRKILLNVGSWEASQVVKFFTDHKVIRDPTFRESFP